MSSENFESNRARWQNFLPIPAGPQGIGQTEPPVGI
jgi:hypothetical protein